MDEMSPADRSAEASGGSTEFGPSIEASPGPQQEVALTVLARKPTELATDRDRLVAAAHSFAEASLAESTRRAYKSDFGTFSLWCHDHPPSQALPTTPETICLYLV